MCALMGRTTESPDIRGTSHWETVFARAQLPHAAGCWIERHVRLDRPHPLMPGGRQQTTDRGRPSWHNWAFPEVPTAHDHARPDAAAPQLAQVEPCDRLR